MLRILTVSAVLAVFAAAPSESRAQVLVTRPQTGFGFSLGFSNGYSFGGLAYQNFNRGFFIAPIHPGYSYSYIVPRFGYAVPAPIYRYPTYAFPHPGFGYGRLYGRSYYLFR